MTPLLTPTQQPSPMPSLRPTAMPSIQPTSGPTIEPTPVPSLIPSSEPTSLPTLLPSFLPSIEPTALPSLGPTPEPTSPPTLLPSSYPTPMPTTLVFALIMESASGPKHIYTCGQDTLIITWTIPAATYEDYCKSAQLDLVNASNDANKEISTLQSSQSNFKGENRYQWNPT